MGRFGQDDNSSQEPGFWDSLFSSSSSDAPPSDSSYQVPSTPLVLAPEAENTPSAAVNPDDPYSKYFKLSDLCVTSLPYPNLPLDSASQNNLRQMGTFLDAIHDNIGPFIVASCYRSPENQLALTHGAGGAAAQKMAVPKSYHSQGLAADITPQNGMTPTAFAQAIYNNPITNALCGQLVDKSEGGEHSLHISIQTPKFPTCTPMYVGKDGQYYRMTKDQIGAWQTSQMNQLDESIDASLDQSDEDYEGDVTSPPWAWIAGGVAAVFGAGYWLYFRKRRKA